MNQDQNTMMALPSRAYLTLDQNEENIEVFVNYDCKWHQLFLRHQYGQRLWNDGYI